MASFASQKPPHPIVSSIVILLTPHKVIQSGHPLDFVRIPQVELAQVRVVMAPVFCQKAEDQLTEVRGKQRHSKDHHQRGGTQSLSAGISRLTWYVFWGVREKNVFLYECC